MDELNKIFRNIILSKSHIVAEYKLERDNFLLQRSDSDEHIKYEINQLLVNEISKNTGGIEKIDDFNRFITYRKELFVFTPKVFKTIIESIVQNLTDEQIKKIKEGEKL